MNLIKLFKGEIMNEEIAELEGETEEVAIVEKPIAPTEGTYFNNAVTAEIQKVIATYASVGILVTEIHLSKDPKPEVAVYTKKI